MMSSAHSLYWQESAKAVPRLAHPFQSPVWHRIKGDIGRYKSLELVVGGQVLAHLGVREIRVPGVYARWAILGEPIPSGTASIDQAKALKALLSLATKERIDSIDCNFNMARWDTSTVESVVRAPHQEAFGTYCIDLTQGTDTIRQGFSKNHKRQLNHAIKAGLTVDHQVDIKVLTEVLEAVYGRTGKKPPFSHAYLRRLLSEPSWPVAAITIGGNDGPEMVCIAPYNHRRGYFLHGGVKPNAARGAAVLGHFELMKTLISRGVEAYDLGGARPWHADPRLKGIADFKRKFGGTFEAVSRFNVPLSRKAAVFKRVHSKLRL